MGRELAAPRLSGRVHIHSELWIRIAIPAILAMVAGLSVLYFDAPRQMFYVAGAVGIVAAWRWSDAWALLLAGVAAGGFVAPEPAVPDWLWLAWLLLILGHHEYRERLGAAARRQWHQRDLVFLSLVALAFLSVIFLPLVPDLRWSSRYAAVTVYLTGFSWVVMQLPWSAGRLRAVWWAYLVSVGTVLVWVPWQSELLKARRFTAWFKDPNVLGAYLVPAILLGWAWAVAGDSGKSRRIRWFGLTLGLAGAYVIHLSASRGAVVNLAFASGVAILALWRRHGWARLGWIRWLRIAGWASVLAVFVWLSLLGPPRAMTGALTTATRATQEVFSELGGGTTSDAAVQPGTGAKPQPTARRQPVTMMARLQPGSSSDVGRLNTYRAGLALFLERPLLGYGPGAYEHYAGEYQVEKDMRPVIRSAHNTYLRVAVEHGVLGVLVLLGLGIPILRALWTSLSAAGDDRLWPYRVATAASVAGMLAHSLLVDTLHWRHWWLFASLLLVLPRIPAEQGSETPGV